MRFKGDYHTHSKYSDGRGTVEEMVAAAAKCGLAEIGLADHGPNNIGTGVKNGQSLLKVQAELAGLELQNPGMKLLSGVEANIISLDGTIDVERDVLEQLDYLLVGLHPNVVPKGPGGLSWVVGNQAPAVMRGYKSRIKNRNTKALVGAIHRYEALAVTHPGLKMEIDIPEVARACEARNTAWEINSGHKHPGYSAVLEAASSGVDFIVNSDAHFPKTVGKLEYGSALLEKAKVPLERIINAME